ncbi:DUF397 domain-containing protein [Saccharopolyspora gloriosae]|uniref:DUF397 domain-containing protein n=1 Tax=Saccharopolyspora gloriosae TaxID=455344 RepID=UPI001FB6BF12|nr:DUF397 domain-containing protein [Saccharopolyspora gloriosae]
MNSTAQLAWRTSSYSSNGESCVDVAPAEGEVLVRHSKHHEAGTISFPHDAWDLFLSEARHGSPSDNGVVTTTRDGTDTTLTALRTEVTLRFDHDEWAAFTAGAEDGEFDFAAPA